MELIVSVNSKELDKYLKFTNSFIIGLRDFSINYFELDLESIKELLKKYCDINLFVAINKNIFNDDLKDLENNLIELSKLNIKGILFYDLSILSIVKRLDLKLDLVYNQGHLVTNYNIVEFYKTLGCKYAYLASDITANEMEEISNKVDINLMALFIGHVVISHSKRKLVSNFYQHIGKNNKNELNEITEKGKDNKYYVIQNKQGTNILTKEILNGTSAFINLKDKLKYGILDNNLISDDVFLDVLKLYKDNIDLNITDDELIKKVSDLIGDYDGFFYTKTIYKVK
ncbi:MAG: U32 family peptidase [Bacilli bacterium]|nr:U32 family peptidase [Bacilli bacterium]